MGACLIICQANYLACTPTQSTSTCTHADRHTCTVAHTHAHLHIHKTHTYTQNKPTHTETHKISSYTHACTSAHTQNTHLHTKQTHTHTETHKISSYMLQVTFRAFPPPSTLTFSIGLLNIGTASVRPFWWCFIRLRGNACRAWRLGWLFRFVLLLSPNKYTNTLVIYKSVGRFF